MERFRGISLKKRYAKIETTEKEIRDMENEMKDAAVNHERSLHVIEEKLRALADKVLLRAPRNKGRVRQPRKQLGSH